MDSSFTKEAISLARGVTSFRPYIMASTKELYILTDAASLVSISGMREYDILSFHLTAFFQNYLAIKDYSIWYVPGVTNILADLFSPAYSRSDLVNEEFQLSKQKALEMPDLPVDGMTLEKDVLYQYLTSEPPAEAGNIYPRSHYRLPQPIPLLELTKLFEGLSPEAWYANRLLLLQAKDDASLRRLNVTKQLVKGKNK